MRVVFLVLIVSLLFAENFKEYKNNRLKEFYYYQINLQKAYNEYKEELNKEFEKYKKELSKYWKIPELSTKKKLVEYSKDKKVRKKIDYERGIVKIDVIAKSKKEAKQKIKLALIKLSSQTAKEAFDENPVLSKITKKIRQKYKNKVAISSPSNELVIGDIFFKKKPTLKEANKFANKAIKKKLVIKNSKLPKSKIYSISIRFPSNFVLIKAKTYKSDVFKRANEFSLTPSLIYAIIHTESYYNPLARSYIPAFGLMQIVPQTAGKDAYKMLYKEEKILSPDYLYNAHNNILIGSAYLHKIYYHYFKRIKNPLSRLYCTIAAYNTGVGNVACAFNSKERDFKGRVVCKRKRGDYSIKKALPIINSMSSKEVYEYLINNLRYDEARSYLKKVSLRYILYLHSIKSKKI
jgi:membrane-bound lytic murein transglycosylase C